MKIKKTDKKRIKMRINKKRIKIKRIDKSSIYERKLTKKE